ncbi:MAG: DUF4129 domain-containing protein [Candidatus Promineifilaceae bacterium]
MAYADPISEDAYWGLISDAATAFGNDADIAPMIEQLTQIESIQRGDELILIDTTYLVSILEDETITREQQARQLRALLATRDQQSVAIDEATLQSTFDTTLSSAEFQYETVFPEWVIRAVELLRRMGEFVIRALEFGADSGIAPVVGWGVAGMAVLGLVGFLWYWLRGVQRQFSSESELDPTYDDADQISADAAFQQAETLAKNSDYRQAVRYLYLSTLLSLDERGLLRYDRSKTNREYLRTVAGSDVSPTLRSVVEVFDRVWYGFQPIDAASYEQYAATVRRLRGT